MEKSSFDPAVELPVMEAFYTIQGEGTHHGKAAYFIRLGGCDVGCVWCDVKESWDAVKWPLKKIDDIVDDAYQYESRLAVITGGEPFMYDMHGLTKRLLQKGFHVNVETSGAHPFTGMVDWICLSPKKFKEPLEQWYDRADELKIIVYNKSDFKWAEEHAKKVNSDCKLLLQPEWGRREEMMPLIVDYVKENPNWSISLQSHKYLQIP